jgi:glycosyltransferase involved in cell wall biosynthesis
MARALAIIPAYNESESLSAVVADLRRERLALDVVVIDDGSSDNTAQIARALDVTVIRFSERLGIGNAVRAGLRYAVRNGYPTAVRVDADGQHSASDVVELLTALDRGADVVLGSRYLVNASSRRAILRWSQWCLGLSLSAITGRCVTDPTCGFCAFGARAIRLLAEHHPTGYPEPELALLLSRNGLTAIERPVKQRHRTGGRTSLTPSRIASAIARVLLAMLIVPLRRPAPEVSGD